MNYIRVETAPGEGVCRACSICRLADCAFKRLDTLDVAQSYRKLQRGDRLESRRGGACLLFWVIVDGAAASCTAFADGRRQIIGLERTGDVVCALMTGNGTQNWLEALCDCEVCEIDLTPVAGRLRQDAAFLEAVFAVAHRRLAHSQAHLATLGRLDSRERVLLFLAEMAARAGRPVVTLPMTREDIADYLGLNAETVSRILGWVKKSGLVRFLSYTEYVVPDLAEIGRRLPVPVPGLERENDS